MQSGGFIRFISYEGGASQGGYSDSLFRIGRLAENAVAMHYATVRV